MRAKEARELLMGIADLAERERRLGALFEQEVRERVKLRFRGRPSPRWECLAPLLREMLEWAMAVQKMTDTGVSCLQYERVFERVTGFTVAHKPSAEAPSANASAPASARGGGDQPLLPAAMAARLRRPVKSARPATRNIYGGRTNGG